MRIDAHQHFWSLARADYGWLTPELADIYRDFLPVDLKPLLKKWDIDGTILVQAAPTLAETKFMLKLAEETSFIKGVVGWVDFEATGAVDTLNHLAMSPHLVGIRPMIQDIPDANWMLEDRFTPIFEAIRANDLVFDALTLPHHLPALRTLVSRHPTLRVVIDHGSKPLIADRIVDGWAEDMMAMAAFENVHCKLSGLVTEASPDWTNADLQPYVAHLLKTFGPRRLIWGSDWPVCTLAASYDTWVETSQDLLSTLPPEDQKAIFGFNAMHLYKIRN